MAKETKIAGPETQEITSAGGNSADAFGMFVGELAQPADPMLRTVGGNFDSYERIRRDEQVQTAFQQRRRAVTSRDWNVEPGGDRPIDIQAADDLKEQLEALSWDSITDKMLWGIFYGFAVAECLWEQDGSRVRLTDIKVRDRKRFRFGRDGSLRLLTRDNPNGLVMPEHKFWTFSAGADNDDELYGLGLAYWLYWPVFFKRNGVKAWAIVLEKFGQPSTIGRYDQSATEGDKRSMLAAIRALATETGVIMPKGMEIEFIEAKRAAGADHNVFAKYMDAASTKIILSQTMTTEDGASQSQATVHLDVRNDVVESDADIACESFNKGPAKWLTAWNFPTAAPPRVWRITDDPEDLSALSERDERLFNMGYIRTPEGIAETYGPGYELKTSNPEPVETPEFAEAEEEIDTVDDIAGQLDAVAAPAMDDMINEIRDVVANATSFEEISDKLVDLYPTMDDTTLADAMREALVVAELNGRSEIIDG